MRLIFLLFLLGVIVFAGCDTGSKTSRQPAEKAAIPTDKSFVVLDFWAEWCGPCKAFAPTFEKVQAKLEGSNVAFVRVNVDVDPEISAKYNIESIPTVIVLANGKEAARFSGGKYINDPEGFEQKLLKVLH